MTCTRSADDIQSLLDGNGDGTLGPIRAAELERHLDECDTCRALEQDLRRIRDAADALGDPEPPDHVWLQIAGRLRQEGRLRDQPASVATPRQQYVWLAIAAALVLAVGASLVLLMPQFTGSGPARTTQQGNAAGADAVQSGVEDLRQAERLLQSGVAKLKEGLGTEDQALPTGVTATLDTNLQILDRAIAESSEALQKEPQNVAARNSLFEALQRKISLLQDTITLMNEMRKGNAAGVAQVVEGYEQIMMRRLIVLTLVACAAAAPAALAQEHVTRLRVVERRVEVERRSEARREEQSRQRRTDDRETQTERIARNVNIGANGEIDLANIAGDILVTRAGGTTAQIEAVKTARAATAEEAREMLALVAVEITERGSRVEARTRYPEGNDRQRNGRRNISVSVAYTVAAPEGTRIIVKSISGDISVRDIRGALTLESISGTVRIANAGSAASGRTISGDVELVDTKVEGTLEAGTISGTVRLRRVAARSVTVNSVSGSVELEELSAERVAAQAISGDITFAGNLQSNGRYEFTSHSGNVRLAIPAGAGFQIEASSFSGSINTDIPITMSGAQRTGRNRSLRGTANGGGASLDLTTFSGSIVITKR